MSTAGEFCRRKVIVARRGEPLRDAARRMRDEHVGCLVVLNGETADERIPVGMLTDRDIVVGVLARTDRHIDNVRVGDVMHEGVVTAFEHEDLDTAVARMSQAGVRRMPIIDNQGKLVGIMAHDDLLVRALSNLSRLTLLVASEQRHERRPGEEGIFLRD